MSLTSIQANDFLLGFYLNTAAVQGRFLRLEKTLDTILHYHNYPPIIAHLLAEVLSLGAILIAQLKTQARLTLQIKGKGLLKLLVVDIDDTGNMRGYADYEQILESKKTYSFAELMNQNGGENAPGTLIITFDQDSGQISQGMVSLQGNSLKESMVHYFKQSVQQEIYLLTQTHQNNQGKWRSATLFLQKNAETQNVTTKNDADEWAYSTMLAQTIKTDELLNFDKPASDLLVNVFHEQEVYFHPCKIIKAQCRCSKEKIQHFIDQLEQQEKNDLKINGQLEVRCEFCNTLYNFI